MKIIERKNLKTLEKCPWLILGAEKQPPNLCIAKYGVVDGCVLKCIRDEITAFVKIDKTIVSIIK